MAEGGSPGPALNQGPPDLIPDIIPVDLGKKYGHKHGVKVTIKTPTPKCRLFIGVNRVYRLEIQSVMLVFPTGFESIAPLSSNPLLLALPPPPFFPV